MQGMAAVPSSTSKDSWLIEYLQSLTMERVCRSGAKRFTTSGAKYVLVRLFVPTALTSPVTWFLTSTAGDVGKNVVSYGFNHLTGDKSQAQVMIAIPEEELESVQAKIQGDSSWHFSLSSMGSKLKRTVHSKVMGACHSILNITYRDLSHGTGATLGSVAASAAFVSYVGPPSLLVLPLYFLAEGGTKSVGAFLGDMLGCYFIGPRALKPVILSAWHWVTGTKKPLEQDYEAILYDLEKLSLEEEGEADPLLRSWYDFKKQSGALGADFSEGADVVQIIEDYQKPDLPSGVPQTDPQTTVFLPQFSMISNYTPPRQPPKLQPALFKRPQ